MFDLGWKEVWCTEALSSLFEAIFMRSKKFLNCLLPLVMFPKCVCSHPPLSFLHGVCRNQRIQLENLLHALMFISVLIGYGLLRPWVPLLQDPIRGPLSWYRFETIFLFGILLSIFTFGALLIWINLLLREDIFIFFSFLVLPWKWHGT